MTIKKTPIGLRLARYRKERGFKTPEALAAAVNSDSVTKSTIVNTELGRKRDLTVNEVLLICEALEIPPVALMTDIEAFFSPHEGTEGLEAMNVNELYDWICGQGDGPARPNDTSKRISMILGYYERAISYAAWLEESRKLAATHLDDEEYDKAERARIQKKDFAIALRTILRELDALLLSPIPDDTIDDFILGTGRHG